VPISPPSAARPPGLPPTAPSKPPKMSSNNKSTANNRNYDSDSDSTTDNSGGGRDYPRRLPSPDPFLLVYRGVPPPPIPYFGFIMPEVSTTATSAPSSASAVTPGRARGLAPPGITPSNNTLAPAPATRQVGGSQPTGTLSTHPQGSITAPNPPEGQLLAHSPTATASAPLASPQKKSQGSPPA